jgi:uncharacterized membrane protein
MGPFRITEVHPIIVHFPIALLITSVVLDILSIFIRRAGLTIAATWCLIFGVPGAAFALLSGWLSEHGINEAAAGSILHWHKIAAVMTTVVFTTLLLIRLIWLAPSILRGFGFTVPSVRASVSRAEKTLRAWLPALYQLRLPRSIVATYLLFSVIGLILLGITGYLGGSMVYDHGIAQPVPPVQQAGQPQQVHGAASQP